MKGSKNSFIRSQVAHFQWSFVIGETVSKVSNTKFSTTPALNLDHNVKVVVVICSTFYDINCFQLHCDLDFIYVNQFS